MKPLPTPTGWAAPLEHYTAWLVSASRPQSTIYLRVYHLRRFARQSGEQPFTVTLDTLVDHMAANPGWRPATRRSVRSSLRGFYAWAVLTGRMDVDPALQLPRVPLTAGRPHPAHDVAVQSGLHAGDERVRLMVKLGAYAGLRCCEIARVHTTDVYQDLVGWSLRVVGKGRKERTIPLSETLALEVRRHPAGWLFPGQIDGHLSAAYVSKIISRAMPAGATAHALRHRFASRAYAGSGYNLRAVQELLGHASVATTQIYTAVDDHELRRAALSAAA